MSGAVRPRALQQTSISTSGGAVTLEPGTRKVKISNYGSNVLRVFFTANDHTANNTSRIDLPATTGFVVLDPCEQTTLWFRSASGTTDAEVLMFAETT